ncbi:MAG: insulinase family protein, partial [Myxococcales bacterium]|nr:insulinase family protein [Myxococcales bacterium]
MSSPRPRMRPTTRAHSLPLLTALTLALACQPKASTEAPPAGGDAPQSAAAAGTDAILAGSDLPPLVERPVAGDAMGVTIHRLANGMTVYISTDRLKPRFNAWIAVRAGSRHDPADSTGLAHYLEHMLFKGTDELGTVDVAAERPHLERIEALYAELRTTEDAAKRAEILAEIDGETQKTAQYTISNELSRLYGELGIEGLNAFTSDDQTVYIADIPSNRLEAWAEVERERFADPVFRLFYPELEAVYEEKNLSLDSPERRISETVRRSLFPAHPYGTQPTIGLAEHLKNPAYADMVAYFERWYAPNNMAIILAGDIDAETALPVLERTLGTLAPKALEAPAAGDLAPISGRVFSTVEAEGEEGVTIAWRTASHADADEPALVVLDWLMDNSTSGLLNLHLELTQKLPGAGSYPSTMREAGYWTVRGTAREGQSLAEVEALLMDVVGKLKAGEFKQETIDAIILHQDISDKQRLESPIGRVSKMAEAYINHEGWSDTLARDQRLRKVTKDDVLRVANKYLGDDRVVVYRKRGKPELPKIDKPKITPLEMDSTRHSPYADKITAMPAETLEPEWLVEGAHFERRALAAGPLVVAKNTRNDLFQLMYDFDLGERRERMLCYAFDALELAGYDDKSPEALREELYALGTDISFNCGTDRTQLQLSGIDANLEASVKIMEAWLRRGELTDESLKKLADNTVSERRDRLDDANYVGYILREYAFYGDNSAFKSEPTNKQLERAKPAQLHKLVRGLLDHEHRTYYFGPRSADAVAKAVAVGDAHRKTTEPAPRRARTAKKPVIFFLNKDVAKSTIAVSLPLGKRPTTERPSANLLGEYLDGDMGSLFFQEIREAR